MKTLRLIIFFLSVALMLWLLAPLYKGVFHIGMAYPLPILGIIAFFSIRPDLFTLIYNKFKVLTIAGISLLCVFIVVFTTLISVMLVYANKGSDKNNTVIILGCQVTGTTPSLMLYDRMTAALEYIEQNPQSYVIASGGKGSGESISEAQAIKDFLLNKGVSEDRILVEDNSVDTKQNIAYSANIIKNKNLNSNVTIITDGFHQFRAARFAQQNSLVSQPYSCDTRWYFSFSYYSREVLAILKMFLF